MLTIGVGSAQPPPPSRPSQFAPPGPNPTDSMAHQPLLPTEWVIDYINPTLTLLGPTMHTRPQPYLAPLPSRFQ
jgi:hypothetical protein